jgi:hypothetical protein
MLKRIFRYNRQKDQVAAQEPNDADGDQVNFANRSVKIFIINIISAQHRRRISTEKPPRTTFCTIH